MISHTRKKLSCFQILRVRPISPTDQTGSPKASRLVERWTVISVREKKEAALVKRVRGSSHPCSRDTHAAAETDTDAAMGTQRSVVALAALVAAIVVGVVSAQESPSGFQEFFSPGGRRRGSALTSFIYFSHPSHTCLPLKPTCASKAFRAGDLKTLGDAMALRGSRTITSRPWSRVYEPS